MSSNVVNIETQDWTPEQVARWVSGQADKGDVARMYVIIEYNNDIIEHIWSESTCESLWYMIGWAYRKFQDRYFDGERVAT